MVRSKNYIVINKLFQTSSFLNEFNLHAIPHFVVKLHGIWYVGAYFVKKITFEKSDAKKTNRTKPQENATRRICEIEKLTFASIEGTPNIALQLSSFNFSRSELFG